MTLRHFPILFFALCILMINSTLAQSRYERQLSRYNRKAIEYLRESDLIKEKLNLKIDSFHQDKKDKILKLYFSNELTHLPVREEWLKLFQGAVKQKTKKRYNLEYYANSVSVEDLIPNYYRNKIEPDPKRYEIRQPKVPHVKNLDSPYSYNLGLNNRHIAIWSSHGLYYSNQDSIWMWQRPNLFTTVEDMLSFSFVVPYIIPMLERAGANVYYPKERDTQLEEIIIDNDADSDSIVYSNRISVGNPGFMDKPFFTDNENPFELGSYLIMPTSPEVGDSIAYFFTPNSTGNFCVYISYAKTAQNVSDVKYKIHHSGGTTSYSVNQQMGSGTWVYLGRFTFQKGMNYKIVIANKSNEDGVITSDAIKIGGGYNRIDRNGSRSPYPAYMNAGRYFLQYAGMPDSAVYSLSYGTHDYQDDYKSRGEWVNYLVGGDYAKNRDSTLTGLNIPVDISFALHTDAGATKNDSIIGTLAIHSTTGLNEEDSLPDGRSRYTNRDLTDIIQTEIIKSIRANHRQDWTRRAIWDRRYSEATYPNIPSILLELLSHQNFEDMKFALNPEFKFDASRAIYKGILKYIASANQQDFVVSPLPVKDLAMFYENGKINLTWNDTIDPLEESARAEAYIVYTQVEDLGFDNGKLVRNNRYELDTIIQGVEYSFKVTAVNQGGESFDSEILSTTIFDNYARPVLIVNGFEKVSGPEFIETDNIGGFAWWEKSAIADGFEYSFTGNQYNFNKNEPWISNPKTGHGASYSTYEGKLKAGNTHDYPKKHGKHFKRHKISYISTSLKGFEKNIENYSGLDKIDFIFGKQSFTANGNKDYSIWRQATRTALTKWIDDNKSLLISGAFIASDVFDHHARDTIRSQWILAKLDYKLITDRASESGKVQGGNTDYLINMNPSEQIYDLRSVDALTYNSTGKVIYRYPERKISAGIYSNSNNIRKVILGFPPESIMNEQEKIFDEIIQLLRWK